MIFVANWKVLYMLRWVYWKYQYKGTFHVKMDSVKNRNDTDLKEAEDIKKRWQEYTEELYKKDFHDPDNHDDVISHLEPDILECEVKWALGSITMNKASGGDGIPVELFKILKYDAVKVLHSICQQIWKTQQWPQDWKRSVFIPIPKKGNAKECSSSVLLLSHVWLFATPWIVARQASLSITISRSSLKLMSIKSVMPSSHLILCHPLLLLPPIPPSIRVFSSESTLRMRWPKY